MAEKTDMKYFYELLKEVKKKRNDTNVFKVLTSIRRYLEWPKHQQQISQFKAMNCFRDVLQILKTSKKQTIDVALSIVENCVMDNDYGKNFLSERSVISSSIDYDNTLASLIIVMERYPRDKTINGGIFNVLANMCMCKEDYAYIVISRHPQFVGRALNFLEVASIDENFCETTIDSALRLLRTLLNNHTVPTLLKPLKALNGVCSFFMKIAAEWEKTGKKENILKKTIEVLVVFSGYDSYDIFSIAKNSEGENCLLCLSKVVVLLPNDILQIIRNFMVDTKDRKLPVWEVSNVLKNILLSSDLQELGYDCQIYVECLCSMMFLPFKRNLEQCRLCVKALINVIGSFRYTSKEEMKCFLLMVRALNSCQDSDLIIREQLDCSAIAVLTSSLGRALGISNNSRLELVDMFDKRYNADYQVADMKKTLIQETMDLISAYRRVQPSHPQLGTKELVLRLVQIIPYFPYGNVYQMKILDHLSDILNCPVYLGPLLQTDIIEQIYDLSLHGTRPSYDFLGYNNYENWAERLLQCLSCVAKSGHAQGNFEKALLEGDENMKEQMILVIPYIAKEDRFLHHLLVACGGLKIMLESIEQNGKYRPECISSLCFLARRRLKISNSRTNTPEDVSEINIRRLLIEEEEQKSKMVSFKLDDGSLVEADLNLLTKKSDYFSVLFSGRFRESVRDEIELHDVDSESFQCVLDLLEEAIFNKYPLKVLLDAVSFSDRFLLTNLCSCLVGWIMNVETSPDTVSAIYMWSLETGLNMFRLHVLRFVLTYEFDHGLRLNMFKELYSLGYIEELLGDIQDLIQEYLPKLNLS
ncbi:uncharacterized protein isoform X1 [Leptinotarsa decemlineata]|uniref:uncharacterized protein isoform X1 n=1 Tax=Leptinotarsa decemlineata TaxID=7539 RepID=UPI003D30BDF5